MTDLQDVSGLNYRSRVISELLISLHQFRQSVSDYVSGPDNANLMSRLRVQIRAVSSTLDLIELQGGALLSQEIEKLLESVSAQRVRNQNDATVILVQASETLPEYVGYIQNGSADIPLALLPLLNDMRAVQNVSLLSEAVMLLPDFSNTNQPEPGSLSAHSEREFRGEIKYARAPLMRSLLNWYRNKEVDASLDEIYTIFDGLYHASKGTDLSRLWRVTLAILDSLSDKGLPTNAAIKSLFGQLERFLQKLMRQKSRAIYQAAPLELFKNLLYYVALSDSDSKKVQQIKSSYQLQELLPSSKSRDQALRALDGPGLEMLDAARIAIREELSYLKSTIEVYAHADEPDRSGLEYLPQRLSKLSSTFQMLGMYRAAERNEAVKSKIERFIGQPDEKRSELLIIASDILRIDTELDDYLHAQEQLVPHGHAITDVGESASEKLLSGQQYDDLVNCVLKESICSLERIKETYLRAIESQQNDSPFALITHLLEETSFALQILPMPELALLFNGLACYTRDITDEYVNRISDEEHQYFADVVSSLEVYIDLQIQRQPVMADLLSRSADALDSLLNLVQDDGRSKFADISDSRVGEKPEGVIEQTIEQKPEKDEFAEPEMVDIYIDEAMQQFSQISENMTKLSVNPEDKKLLENIRRSFHTLKGSGRMVGANAISEFAWAIENLVNRVLSGSIKLEKPVFNVLEESTAALPQLIDQIHGATEQVDGIDVLMATAFKLAENSGKDVPSGHDDSPTLADLEASEIEQNNLSEKSEAEIEILTRDDEKVEPSEDVVNHARVISDEATDPNGLLLDLTQTLDVTGVVEASDTMQLPPMEQADTIEMAPTGMNRAPELQVLNEDKPVVRLLENEAIPASGVSVGSTATNLLMDPALLDIFTKECALHISTLKEILGKNLSGDGKTNVTEQLVRALHTLTGSAQTAHAHGIANLLVPIESAIKQKQRAGSLFSRGETLFLSEVIRALEYKLEFLSSGEVASTFITDVESRVGGFVDRVNAETADLIQTPRLGELQTVFIDEAQDIVEHLLSLINKWKCHTQDHDIPMELQSNLHTLKGSARVASYTGIADLAHAMEDAVQRLSGVSTKINVESFDALSDAADALNINLEQARTGDTPGYFDWLINELSAVESASQPELDEDTRSVLGDIAKGVSVLADEGYKTVPSDENLGVGLTPAPERIRLDSAIIQRLSDLNNESNVYQSHIGQQQNKMAESLLELDQTVNRLRFQLRDLDLESDLFIAADKPSQKVKEFDPLELDKYAKLQELSRVILESFSDLDDIRYSLSNHLRQTEVELREQTRAINAIQETLAHVRLVRFQSSVVRLRTTFEQTITSLGKSAELYIHGAENVVDQSLLKPIISALEHLLRNAAAHGIETSEQRLKNNKSSSGRVDLRFKMEEGNLFISIEDDGIGIDSEVVRNKAIKQGLLKKDVTISEQLLLKLLSTSGFSTATELDQISGRGVGLDAVQRELRKIGGQLTVKSRKGKGAVFTIRIVQSQFVNHVLLVGLSDRTFALPANHVHGISRLNSNEFKKFIEKPDLQIRLNNHRYHPVSLSGLLNLPEDLLPSDAVSLIQLNGAYESVAIQVSTIPGHIETIVKPVGRQLAALGIYSGACVQSDGSVVPVLDINNLLSTVPGQDEVKAIINTDNVVVAPETRLRVLVVDDSITMRKYAERALLKENYLPMMARDGVEAIGLMQQFTPDLVLTDLEMPRMDGFELISMVRDDAKLKAVPIVVITSRTGEKHRQRLEKSAIQGFLGKPYQESELLDLIKSLQKS